MKKILGIFAASAAALGSAMIAAPVEAQTAILPVQIQVTPAIYLRTFTDLQFIVSQQDLTSGSSVDVASGSYIERNGTRLPITPPNANGTGTVTKKVPVLYQIWNGTPNAQVTVSSTKTELKTETTDDFGQSSTTEVTMAVTDNGFQNASDGAPYREGSADFTFTFPENIQLENDATFTGGEIEILVVTP